MTSIARTLALVVALVAALPATAADRAEKIRHLMRAQGLVETFEQQIAISRDACQKQADQIMTQAFSGLRLSAEYQAKVRGVLREYVDSVQPDNADALVDTWARLYGAKFTDDELDQLLAYYTSALAQKEVRESRSALAQFSAETQAAYAPRLQAATTTFVERLKAIAKECNCREGAGDAHVERVPTRTTL